MQQVAGNPWLARLFLGGAATVLIGLAIVLVVQADKACFSDRCVPEGFTGTQIVGLGLMVIGLLTLVGWLAAAAVCWQLDRQRGSA